MERQRSLLGPLKNGPEWVLSLKYQKRKQGKQRVKKEANDCSICEVPLMNRLEKRICNCCGEVTCRDCTGLVHLLDFRRRKFVCFRCLKDATAKIPDLPGTAKAVSPSSSGKSSKRSSKSRAAPAPSISEDAVAAGFMDRIWGMWGGWMDQEEGDDGDHSADEDADLAPVQESSTKSKRVSSKRSSTARGTSSKTTTADEVRNTVPSGHVRRRSQKMQEAVDAEEISFDGFQMAKLLDSALSKNGDINAKLFLDACAQVVMFTAALGKTFGFASVDLNHKIDIVHRRVEEYSKAKKVSEQDVSLQQLVEYDIERKLTHAGKKAAPASRTILRLLWFIDFNRVMLRKLSENPKMELKKACAETYEATLSPRHAFVLRRMVRMGLGLTPSRDLFRKRAKLVGLTEKEESNTLMQWVEPCDKVADQMWGFMTEKSLQKLP